MKITNSVVANAMAAKRVARNASVDLTSKQKAAQTKITLVEKAWDDVVNLHNERNQVVNKYQRAVRDFDKALIAAEKAISEIPDDPSNFYNDWTSAQRRHIKGMRDEYKDHLKWAHE